MKKIFYVAFLFTITLFGQNDAVFKDANSAYTEGKYELAIQKYEEIIENGEASAALYYNLGNAHYKLNNIAPSIYYYEKALQLKPGDEDVINNIEFARNMTIDDIPVIEQSGLQKTINRVIAVFGYNTWAWLAIAASILFLVLFLLYYFSLQPFWKRLYFGVSIAMLLLAIVSLSFAYSQQNIQFNNKYAIVFSEEAAVRSEPSLRVDAAFELHEGTKAKLLEDYQGWVKIQLADGTQGWISEKDLKKL